MIQCEEEMANEEQLHTPDRWDLRVSLQFGKSRNAPEYKYFTRESTNSSVKSTTFYFSLCKSLHKYLILIIEYHVIYDNINVYV